MCEEGQTGGLPLQNGHVLRFLRDGHDATFDQALIKIPGRQVFRG